MKKTRTVRIKGYRPQIVKYHGHPLENKRILYEVELCGDEETVRFLAGHARSDGGTVWLGKVPIAVSFGGVFSIEKITDPFDLLYKKDRAGIVEIINREDAN